MSYHRPTACHYIIAFIAILFCSWPNHVLANEVRYRYKNDYDVPVISNNIPAKYAQNGYEILDINGNVLEIVPPAPSEEEVKQATKEKEILNQYHILKRRFSTIDDIERAKQRKLKNINTNISILKGNISNLENGIQNLVEQAAQSERAGRKVPKTILDRLEDTKAELKISEDLLSYREQEFNDTIKKFDKDINAFIQGESLDNKRNASTNNY